MSRWIELRPGQLLVAYAALSYAVLIALTASALAFGNIAVRHQVDQRLTASATASAEYVGESLRARAAALGGFADRPLVVVMLSDQQLASSELAEMDAVLAQLGVAVGGADSMGVTDAHGNLLDMAPSTPARLGTNLAYREWFQGAISTGAPYLAGPIASISPGSPIVVSLSAPVYGSDGGLLGVIVASFTLDTIQRFVSAFSSTQAVELTINDRAGRLVAQPGGHITKLTSSTDPDVVNALHGLSGTDDSSSQMFKAYAQVPWAGWSMIAQVPTSVAFADFNEMARSVLLTSVVLALLNLGGIHLLYVNFRRRRAAEEELRDVNSGLEFRVATRTAALEATNRELETFAYSVSHDLRAPLRAMSGFANLLSKKFGPSLDAEARQYTERIDANAKKMGNLIDELLRFSRVGRAAMSLAEVDPTPLVTTVVQDFSSQAAEGGVEVTVSQLPPCSCDAALLHHVYSNLISNAVKFSRGRPNAKVEVTSHIEDGQPVYDVLDNGVGFDMRYADKLFGVFQRLHSEAEFEGTGVGLAIVQKIVQRHGGRVWAEAEVGKGASFHFTLGGRAQ